ncbi:MAG: ABC transporter ATP-binding protein [Acetobacteraceae bacterium]|nr:ABC transporter ATP-binding protein [Acetobacteraceae bacterium]
MLEGVGKRFAGGVQALAGVGFSVSPGDFVALLGPSGCGKSSLLRIIAALAEPTEGSVVRPASTGGEIGFVFQDPTLMPWASALANVMLPLRLAGARREQAAAQATAALAAVGLAGFERARPRALSGGMRMRASFARALVTGPKLLLMDEPFAALDEITRFRLNDDLLALWRERHFTALFVTHSVFESVYLAQRVLVMAARPGRIVADIAIEGPRLRDATFRTSPEYAAQCRAVSGALAAAMAA